MRHNICVKLRRDISLRYVLEQMFVWFLCNMTIKKSLVGRGSVKRDGVGVCGKRSNPLIKLLFQPSKQKTPFHQVDFQNRRKIKRHPNIGHLKIIFQK